MPSEPENIDPQYQPQASIVRVPVSTPFEHILAIIERDGGVILEGLVSQDELALIDEEVKPWAEKQRRQVVAKATPGSDAFHTIPRQTVIVPGLVGKSDTIAGICEHPVLEKLRQTILKDVFTVVREDWRELNTIDPLLSASLSLNIGYGAPRQRLHRDDNTHGIRHPEPKEWSFQHTSQFGCLIAGCEVTRENGATMFVPGSHKWDDHRQPTTNEVCFAGIDLASTYYYLCLYCHRNVSRLRAHLSRVFFPRSRP